mgnify:CR=1 FL=1
MPLTDTAIRKAKPGTKPYKISDAGYSCSLPLKGEVVAREWFAKEAPEWVHGYLSKVIRRYISPWIGDKPIAEITAPQLLDNVIRRIEHRPW